MAASLVRHLAGAVRGPGALPAAPRSSSTGSAEQIASPGVTIVDDGTMPGGARLAAVRRRGAADAADACSSDEGVLDVLPARHLQRAASSASASTHTRARDGSGVTVAHDQPLCCCRGTADAEASSSRRSSSGLYVTELIGFGVNGVTGDYSRGAAGLWIENGELAYPVEEITIAGNLLEMFAAIEGVGNDLVLRDRTVRPPCGSAGWCVAGT